MSRLNSNIISIVNQKGGVGKSTTAVNLSAVLAIIKKKNVLLIDIDSQGNSSSGIGINQTDRKITSYHIFTKINNIKSAIQKTNIANLSIIPSNINLATIELKLLPMNNHENILSEALESIANLFDYIIIDCPPSLNILTLNALVACNKVIIPMLCDFYSLEGLSHLLKTIKTIKKKLNSNIEISGILFTMYDKRNNLTEQVENDVRTCLGKLVFQTTIPRNVRIAEAPSHGKAAIIYDYKCLGSRAYVNFTQEFIKREQIKRNKL